MTRRPVTGKHRVRRDVENVDANLLGRVDDILGRARDGHLVTCVRRMDHKRRPDLVYGRCKRIRFSEVGDDLGGIPQARPVGEPDHLGAHWGCSSKPRPQQAGSTCQQHPPVGHEATLRITTSALPARRRTRRGAGRQQATPASSGAARRPIAAPESAIPGTPCSDQNAHRERNAVRGLQASRASAALGQLIR